jgi:hypothetical protein
VSSAKPMTLRCPDTKRGECLENKEKGAPPLKGALAKPCLTSLPWPIRRRGTSGQLFAFTFDRFGLTAAMASRGSLWTVVAARRICQSRAGTAAVK